MRKERKRNIIGTVMALSLWGTFSLQTVRAEQPPMSLWYDKPATVWMTSALPLGNGELGGMFFGGVAVEQMQFNEKTLWTGSTTKRGAYQNFGDLFIEFANPDIACTDYHRELSLDDAVGTVIYRQDGVRYHREYFASRPDGVIAMHLTPPERKSGSRSACGWPMPIPEQPGPQTDASP